MALGATTSSWKASSSEVKPRPETTLTAAHRQALWLATLRATMRLPAMDLLWLTALLMRGPSRRDGAERERERLVEWS